MFGKVECPNCHKKVPEWYLNDHLMLEFHNRLMMCECRQSDKECCSCQTKEECRHKHNCCCLDIVKTDGKGGFIRWA